MQRTWISRLFFAVVAALAVAGTLTGTACTRWGHAGPVPPTLAPLSAIYVDAVNGSDTSGNGSQLKPYKTLTKAIDVLASSKSLSDAGVTIHLENGDYNAANGEKFPIVVPTSVTIDGTTLSTGPKHGAYIDGSGQDTVFEELVHAAPRSAYTAFEIAAGASVTLNDVYVGDADLKLPSSQALYFTTDVLGTLTATTAAFGTGMHTSLPNVSGILVAGGTLSCTSCRIQAKYFGVGGLAVPVATASPSSSGPTVTLSHGTGTGDSTVAADQFDILTDGSTNVTVSGETFERSRYAFQDSLRPVVAVTSRGTLDFGGGLADSPGGNILIGARTTEISIVRRFETLSALDDAWNPNQQHANRNGQYPKKITFNAGASGENVTILHDADGSTVTVGPAPVPTPTPSSSPSASPSISPSTTPSP
jgi:hypothetical protein